MTQVIGLSKCNWLELTHLCETFFLKNFVDNRNLFLLFLPFLVLLQLHYKLWIGFMLALSKIIFKHTLDDWIMSWHQHWFWALLAAFTFKHKQTLSDAWNLTASNVSYILYSPLFLNIFTFKNCFVIILLINLFLSLLMDYLWLIFFLYFLLHLRDLWYLLYLHFNLVFLWVLYTSTLAALRIFLYLNHVFQFNKCFLNMDVLFLLTHFLQKL